MHPNQAARLLIMSAYLYYRCDSPVISDGEYDKLSLYVAKNWDALDEQLQWQLGDRDSIRATGSGIIITQMGQNAAHAWYHEKTGRHTNYQSLSWRSPHSKYKCIYATI